MIAGSEAAARQKTTDANPGTTGTKSDDPLLNLVVLVHPRELEKATIRSLLADTMAASNFGSSPRESKTRDELAATLEVSRKRHPGDLSLAIAEALLALGSGETRRIGPALARLDELVQKTPLEVLEGGARANSRQRAVAARQIPLWLVARACWKQKNAAELNVLAGKLAARAQEAARRQAENPALLAMLREQGEFALARGDRAAAEAAWSQMLRLVVEPGDRPTKKTEPRPRKPAATAEPSRAASVARSRVRFASYQVEQPPPSRKGASGGTPAKGAGRGAPLRSNIPLLTLDRFEQAMQIARLAAEHDLPDLSVRAVREALRAGPPIVPAAPPSPRALARARAMDSGDGPADQVSPRVVANLIDVERIWRKHNLAQTRRIKCCATW